MLINSLLVPHSMVILQKKSNRKPTGGRYKAPVVRRQAQAGSQPTLTKIGNLRIKQDRTMGGKTKLRVLDTTIANVYDQKTKKHSKATITSVIENTANPNFTRRNIMTKGSIIETSAGKAKVTNTPGQEGAVNAILI